MAGERYGHGMLCVNWPQIFCEEEFGVEHEAKVSDMWIPRDSGVLKLKWERECRAVFST